VQPAESLENSKKRLADAAVGSGLDNEVFHTSAMRELSFEYFEEVIKYLLKNEKEFDADKRKSQNK
jgi:hypothetical protein